MRTQIISFIAGLVAATALTISGIQFYNAHSNSCDRTNNAMDVVRDILLKTEPSPAKAAKETTAQKVALKAFYDYSFMRIKMARC